MTGFNINRKDDTLFVIFHLQGYLDAHTATQFEQAIEVAMKEKRFKMIVNLEKLDYISSAGLGVFMGFIEDIREQNGDIKICLTSDKVYKVFDLLGFPSIFDIVKDEDEAKAKFN
jgi:anti-sigma B factor antagonist